VRANGINDQWADWMRAGLSGDSAAYRRLLIALAPPLRAFSRRLFTRAGLDPGEAEDSVQETLLALHLKRQTWDPATPLEPWLYAIARHKVVDAIRRRGRKSEVPLEGLEDTLSGAEEEDTLSTADARRMTATLRGRERDVVEAVCLDDASIREVGARYAMSEGAVRVALHRGLKRLADAFRSAER